MRSPVTTTDSFASIDSMVHAAYARMHSSLSPESTRLAWQDWASHLMRSPGKQLELAALAMHQTKAIAHYLSECLRVGPGEARACIDAPVQDPRFREPEWRQWPFNLWHQSFLLQQQWWEEATSGVWGVEKHHADVVAFTARQWLDMFSPGNQLATNPVVLKRTFDEGGRNLQRGAIHAVEDMERALTGALPAGAESFIVGRDVGVTPGKVVLKNRLIELIQYSPSTGKVRPEPILVIPAWIMKYYILDLSPHNSLIRYLVSEGYTVFCISWKNPNADDRDLGMDDYLSLGFHAAIDAVNAIVPQQKVHAAGYCLGGTLLAIAAAAMARDSDERLASMTLLNAQTDFTEPGELGLFIDESQVSLLEAQMTQTGYLTAKQMAGAFQMLRSYDLMWSRQVNSYLLGERPGMFDLMAWNADATRLPATMHSQYLRRLYLDNDLAHGRYPVQGKPVALCDITLPLFCVGTETDHVAPWKSVYKLHHLTSTEITFVLTSGGHNAGIVSEPDHPRRHHRIRTQPADAAHLSAEAWLHEVEKAKGSWWPQWSAWLNARSGKPVPPPGMGAADAGYPIIADAPGTYVLEK